MREVLRVVAVVACGCVAVLGACTTAEEAVSPSVPASETASPGAPGAAPWVQLKVLLTGAEVLEALGDPTAEVVHNEMTWGGSRGFDDPEDPTDVPEVSPGMDASVYYALERSGDSRTLVSYVDEAVAGGPDVEQSFATWETLVTSRVSGEGYDPAPIGFDAFAYESDGGAGALDRMVVVNTGQTLVVIDATTASPVGPEPDLTVDENLTRDQVDDLVRAAVEKLG